MGMRRMLQRLSKDRKFWIFALVSGYFYVTVSQLISMSGESDQENQLRYENSHRRSGRKAESSIGEEERDYIHEYPDLLENPQRLMGEDDDSYGDAEKLEKIRNNEYDNGEDYDDDEEDNDDDDEDKGGDDEEKDVLVDNNDEGDEEEDDDDDDDDEDTESDDDGNEKNNDGDEEKDVLDDNNGDKDNKNYENKHSNDKKMEDPNSKDTEKDLNDENEKIRINPNESEDKEREHKGNIEGNIAGNLNEGGENLQEERPNEYQNRNWKRSKMEGEIKVNIKNVLRIENREISYNGYFKLNEAIDGTPVKKVILLTYQRAGSSFTGELLTAGGEAMYVFEPLYLWRKVLGPGADPNLERKAALVLGDILDCRPEVIAEWKRKGFTYFRQKLEVNNFCEAAKLRLLKTIRARAHFILPWIKERTDIKIVHLVRDPRGILNSVQRGGRWWSDNNRNTRLQCGLVERDLELETLGTDRYLRVRYENLVDNPVEETKRIFAFMGMTFNEAVMGYIKSHTGTGENQEHRPGYFNTFRNSEFRHDQWKEKLDNREIEFIENICSSVMRSLGYTMLPPT